ncbi:hypothetical protein FKM82_028681 [Ascaphus truei]|uniref:dual specificity protein phosphatase 13B-like n=1 Tax=Ascaphus truei TaxID=8439 RepID=UPI003F5ABE2D
MLPPLLDQCEPLCLAESRRMLWNRDSDMDPRKSDFYETPALADLERLLWTREGSPSHLDQVWPNLYVGDAWAARNKVLLHELRVTHVLNAAHGRYNVDTGSKFYQGLPISYLGVEAFDEPSFDLSTYFEQAANFIKQALDFPGGKVLVHCGMGISRAPTMVLAYLMIHKKMTIVDAIKTVKSHRNICPNSGFLSQLRHLEVWLQQKEKHRSQ